MMRSGNFWSGMDFRRLTEFCALRENILALSIAYRLRIPFAWTARMLAYWWPPWQVDRIDPPQLGAPSSQNDPVVCRAVDRTALRQVVVQSPAGVASEVKCGSANSTRFRPSRFALYKAESANPYAVSKS